MEDREIGRIRRGLRTAKHVNGPRQQVRRSFRNLGGMHAKLYRQLRLRLDSRPVIASCSLHRLAPQVRPPSGASVKQGYHLAHCPNSGAPS